MGLPTCLVIDPLNCFITLEIVGANYKRTSKLENVFLPKQKTLPL